MTDALDSIQNRLRWLNRGILAAGLLVLVGVFVVVLRGLHEQRAAPVAHASAASRPMKAASPPKAMLTRATVRPASNPSVAAVAAAASSAMLPPAYPVAGPVARPAAAAASGSAPRTTPRAGSGAAMRLAPALPKAVPTPVASVPVASGASESPHGPAVPVNGKAPGRALAHHAHAGAPHRAPHRQAVPAAAARGMVCARGGWYVQVGAFAERGRVTRLRAQLSRHGLRSCVGARRLRGLELVYVGPFASRKVGAREQLKLQKLLNNNNYLRHVSMP